MEKDNKIINTQVNNCFGERMRSELQSAVVWCYLMKLVRKGPTDKEQFERNLLDVREQVMQERLGIEKKDSRWRAQQLQGH